MLDRARRVGAGAEKEIADDHYFSREERGVALTSAAVAVAIALIGLAGWIFGARPLYNWAGVAQTKPDTAVGLALGGAALAAAAFGGNRKWHVLPGGLVGAAGALFLVEYATGFDFGIDNLIVRDPSAFLPGRPSIPTSICFFAVGPAIALVSAGSGAARLLRSVFILIAATTAMAGFIAYAFSPVVNVVENVLSGFALSTAVAFLCLVVGVASIGRPGNDRRYFVRHGAPLLGLATLLAVVLATLVGLQSARRAQAQIDQAVAADGHLAALLLALQGAESSQRSYLITGAESYFKPYDSAVSNVDAELEALARVASGSPAVSERLSKTRESVAATLAGMKRSMDLKRQGEDPVDIVRSEASQTTMDAIRRIVAEGRAVEESRIADLSRRAARVALELQLAILVTVALIVALAAYLVLETRRNFQALAAALRAVVETNENLERTVEAKTSQIRESEEKLRNAVADAAIGFAMNTPDGVYIDANPAYCRLTGYSLEELRGMTFSEVVHPDDAVSNMENARRMLGGEIDNYVVENRYRRKDGAAVWVRKSLSTTRDEKGKYKWIVALVEDVSERKQAEAELLRLNATLEQRVHEAIEARQAAQSRLAQAEKLGALGQLAGGVAHDFNNIAQAVTGGASMIGRHADDPVRVRRYAGMLAEAATRAASITRRLLSLARRGHLQAEAVEVAPLLEGLREFLSHTLGANVAMQLKAPTSMPRVLVDKGQLKD